jgi:16S rRNA processing protein RimM
VLVILHGEVEVMVPLVEEMIVDIDMEERSMTIRTPEGLIDLYRTLK